jgi:hypothetical protein
MTAQRRESKTSHRRRQAQRLVLGQYGKEGTLSKWQEQTLTHWASHPWNFLTGQNEDGTPIYWTKDEKDPIDPIKPFPVQWEFLYHFVHMLHTEPMVITQKSRQQYITTVSLGVMFWDCLFTDARRWLISKITEEDAVELLRDKIRYPYSRLPAWFRRLYPASPTPTDRMDFSGTSSYIRAVAENAAIGDMRGGTASGVLVDEAAFQREYKKIWGAATPMAARIWAVSTPEIGNPGARFMKAQIDESVE